MDKSEIATKMYCGDNKDTYSPLQCMCYNQQNPPSNCEKDCVSAKDNSLPSPSISVSACYTSKTKCDNKPFGSSCGEGNPCALTYSKDDVENGYLYYSYQIMDPLSAFVDVAGKLKDMFNPTALIKWIIIAVGILLVLGIILFIVYKISTRGSGDGAVHIEMTTPTTKATPTTVAKFGNYLNNYAYMGLCNVYPT